MKNSSLSQIYLFINCMLNADGYLVVMSLVADSKPDNFNKLGKQDCA